MVLLSIGAVWLIATLVMLASLASPARIADEVLGAQPLLSFDPDEPTALSGPYQAVVRPVI